MLSSSAELRYIQSELKVDYSRKNLLRMNLNENLVMPLSRFRSMIAKCMDEFDPRYYSSELDEREMRTLANEIAMYAGCATSSVGLGFGSDQIIDLVFKMKFAGTRRRMVTVDPTYDMYSVLAKRLGAQVSLVKLAAANGREPFSLNQRKVVQSAKTKDVGVLVLASPNNPTGLQYPAEQIIGIIESLPNVTVLIDEAYVEYSDYSACKFLSDYQNLALVRTFSKAFGMANLRLGYLLSSDTTMVDRFKSDFQYPYPVAGFAVLMATKLLRNKRLVLEYAEKTRTYRTELIEALQRVGLNVIPRSNANFVLIQSKRAKRIAEALLSSYSIAVKYIARIGEESEFLRITVGSREMNERLLYSLRRIVAS